MEISKIFCLLLLIFLSCQTLEYSWSDTGPWEPLGAPPTPCLGLEEGSLGVAPRQGGSGEDTSRLPGEFAESCLHGFLSKPAICTCEKLVSMCTSVNGGMLYEFKVNNCIKSNLKLSSPSPRIAATTWSAPSFNFSGHCRQVEAHLEQHLRVYVLQRGRRSRNSLTGIWCKCTCQQQCSPRCS